MRWHLGRKSDGVGGLVAAEEIPQTGGRGEVGKGLVFVSLVVSEQAESGDGVPGNKYSLPESLLSVTKGGPLLFDAAR